MALGLRSMTSMPIISHTGNPSRMDMTITAATVLTAGF